MAKDAVGKESSEQRCQVADGQTGSGKPRGLSDRKTEPLGAVDDQKC